MEVKIYQSTPVAVYDGFEHELDVYDMCCLFCNQNILVRTWWYMTKINNHNEL